MNFLPMSQFCPDHCGEHAHEQDPGELVHGLRFLQGFRKHSLISGNKGKSTFIAKFYDETLHYKQIFWQNNSVELNTANVQWKKNHAFVLTKLQNQQWTYQCRNLAQTIRNYIHTCNFRVHSDKLRCQSKDSVNIRLHLPKKNINYHVGNFSDIRKQNSTIGFFLIQNFYLAINKID